MGVFKQKLVGMTTNKLKLAQPCLFVYLHPYGVSADFVLWNQRFSFSEKEILKSHKEARRKREKTSGSGQRESHYHAKIGVTRLINKQSITTHLSDNSRSEYAIR